MTSLINGAGGAINRRALLGLVPAGLIGAGVASAATIGSAPIELRFSQFLGPDSYFQTDLIVPWAGELEALTQGKVKVTVLSGADPTGEVTQQATHVERGTVDIALGLRGAEGARMPGSSLIELPMLVRDSATGSQALWRLFEEGAIADDYRNLKPLALFVHNPGVVHTLARPVVVPEDLKGLRLRVPNSAVALAISRLGAIPSILQVREVMPAVAAGELDGVITNWGTPLPGFYETLRFHTDVPFYAAAFFIAMNQARFAALPPFVQRSIEALSGRPLVDRVASLWNRWDGAGLKSAQGPGHVIIRPRPAEHAAWVEALRPATDLYLDELSRTYPPARPLFKKVEAAVAEAPRPG